MEKSNNKKRTSIEELHDKQLELFSAVIDICNTYGIEYYLAFGTLLGAVRHQGFIPWDDDMDLFMTRKSLNKFLSLPTEAFPDNIHIRTYLNTTAEQGDVSIQTKIERTDIKVLRQVGDNVVTQNIWIDIFVIDGMPANALKCKLHYYNIRLHEALYRIARSADNGVLRDKKRSTIEKIGIKIMSFIPVGKLLDVKTCMKNTDKVLSTYKAEDSKTVIAYAPEYGMKCIVPQKCFAKKKLVYFEGVKTVIPNGYDTLLRSWYGDYMTLPPKECRVVKHIISVVKNER